jgi:hypothetical protein
MKQITLDFHPASELPEIHEDILITKDFRRFIMGFLQTDGRYNIGEDCIEDIEGWSWVYLPKAEECADE